MDGELRDGGGRPAAPPRRIVSLVPSVTESLFALGLGGRVVGVTDFCVYPEEAVARLPKVGGTKNPSIETVVGLEPELVIANHEENTRRAVEALRRAGLRVWVTYPRTTRQGAALLRELAGLGAPPDALDDVVAPVEAAVSAAERGAAGGHKKTRYFCPIWRGPWMTIGRDTYAHDLLALCGGDNPFADRAERRYPRVRLEEVEAAQPEVILLPDEPYAFGLEDAEQLAALDVPAAQSGRIHLIDGSLVSWYGPRIRRALAELTPLLAPVEDG